MIFSTGSLTHELMDLMNINFDISEAKLDILMKLLRIALNELQYRLLKLYMSPLSYVVFKPI